MPYDLSSIRKQKNRHLKHSLHGPLANHCVPKWPGGLSLRLYREIKENRYVCMYVCMYVCKYVCMYVCMYFVCYIYHIYSIHVCMIYKMNPVYIVVDVWWSEPLQMGVGPRDRNISSMLIVGIPQASNDMRFAWSWTRTIERRIMQNWVPGYHNCQWLHISFQFWRNGNIFCNFHPGDDSSRAQTTSLSDAWACGGQVLALLLLYDIFSDTCKKEKGNISW